MPADFDQVDFFSDPSLLEDPYPYFEHLRGQCPVTRLPHHGVVAVSGYDEATDVYRDVEAFSSCNSVIGPFATFPVPLEGDDVSDLIERYRDHLPMHEHLVTMDPPRHTRERALLMRLLTPKRLRENEEFMWRLADRQLDEFLADGRCEFIAAYSQPFAMLVVADLLGVPESDHRRFREGFGLGGPPGELGVDEMPEELNALGWLDEWFTTYVEERRREPRADVLTDLALARYPDGSTPDVTAVVRTATFLFAAGQETTARLLATALRFLAEDPDLQEELRDHRDRIPDFLEEALRLESPVKADFRLARRATSVGGVEIAAGTPVMLLNGAANRDPRRFERPAELRLDRPNVREHLAFGRGVHSCPGGPLARAEGRISLERILDRMRDIRLSEEHHGPPGDRRFEYEPTWVLRGLRTLHLEFTPVAS
jgi:cytochrome P450